MPKKVIIAGKVEGMTKDGIKQILPSKYEMPRCFSKSIDLLVTAKGANKTRIEEAKGYGIEIIPWEEFIKKAGIEDKVSK